MIYAICGTPGSFKSCYAVEKFVIPALKSGRAIYTNIEGLNPLYIATYYNLDPVKVDTLLNPLGRVYDEDGTYHEDRDLIREFYKDLPLNALVIIDEAQNYFPSRDFKEKYSADLIPWITKHRHLGNDVVWITQVLESVDISFRRNTHLTYAMRRAENLGLKNSSFIYTFDRADIDRKHLTRSMYSPDKTIFKLYSSYQTEEVEEKRKSYNVLLRSPFVWLAIVVFIWAGYVLLSGTLQRNVFKAPPKKKEVKQKTEQVIKEQEQKIEQIQEVVDGTCYTKTAKIRGQIIYYLNDNTTTTLTHYKPCESPTIPGTP